MDAVLARFLVAMDASLTEQSAIPGRQGFRPGISGNPGGRLSNAQKRALIESTARTLADGKFDSLSARDRELLILAATLKLTPRRPREDLVRRSNSIARILNRVHGLRPAEPPPPSFEDALLP
jgi:hypothetical protein